MEKNLPEVTAIAFSPDSKTLAAGKSDSTITLWDVMSEKAIANLEGQKGFSFSLVFSPDGKMLASGSADSGNPTVGTADEKTHCHFERAQECCSLRGVQPRR